MNLIVAVDKNWGIGKDGGLLCHNPIDMKFFKDKTMGSVIIMGRKTLESFPGAKALPGRVNIVFSSQDVHYDNCIVVHNVEELQNVLKWHKDKAAFVIGGGQIYEKLLPLCDTAYVTKMGNNFEADTFMRNLDEDPEWKMREEGNFQEYNDIKFRFCIYERI